MYDRKKHVFTCKDVERITESILKLSENSEKNSETVGCLIRFLDDLSSNLIRILSNEERKLINVGELTEELVAVIESAAQKADGELKVQVFGGGEFGGAGASSTIR